MKRVGKCLAQVLSVIVGGVALAVPFAGPASAGTPRDGHCDLGEFCLYWGYGRTGSLSDFNGSITNYGDSQPTCYEFISPGLGKGECVKNNAVSAWNNTQGHRVTVYFNSGHKGASDTLYPGSKRDLSGTLQFENASHKFELLP
jgi:hypothetical protein